MILRSQLLQLTEQRMLAKVTPVDRILPVPRNIDLIGFKDHLTDVPLLAEFSGLSGFARREGLGGSGESNRLFAKYLMCRHQKERGIHTAGKRHCAAPHVLQNMLQCLKFLLR